MNNALKRILISSYYKHFLNISLSIRILCNVLLESANNLFNYYVYNSNECYGDKLSVCNVHRLIHIAHDVEYFKKPLQAISGVSFENYLQELKRYVRSRHNSVPQI